MTTAEDCRRKAEQWINAALTASDPNTGASMRRVSELWTALADQIERTPSSAVKRPADLAKHLSNRRAGSVQIGDVLRERLRIGDGDFDQRFE